MPHTLAGVRKIAEPRALSGRVVLADDRGLILEGIRRLLEPEFDVVGVAGSGEELLTVAAAAAPDLVVAGETTPGPSGAELVRRLHAAHPEVRIVLLAMHPDAVQAAASIRAGASGFVLVHADPPELVHALRTALDDDVFVSPAISEAAPSVLAPVQLSQRQREILSLLSRGRAVKEIATSLRISPKTVEYHKYRMMDLLHLRTSAELIRYAVESGVA